MSLPSCEGGGWGCRERKWRSAGVWGTHCHSNEHRYAREPVRHPLGWFHWILTLAHGRSSRFSRRDFPGSAMVRTLPSSAGSMGSLPAQGAKILHALWPKKQYCNKFNKDFLNGPHKKKKSWGFPGGSVVKNPPANAGDLGSILNPGRFHMLHNN